MLTIFQEDVWCRSVCENINIIKMPGYSSSKYFICWKHPINMMEKMILILNLKVRHIKLNLFGKLCPLSKILSCIIQSYAEV